MAFNWPPARRPSPLGDSIKRGGPLYDPARHSYGRAVGGGVLTDESMSDSRLVLDRLIALCREDISRTDRILRDLQSSLAIRGTDGGIVVPRPIAALGQEIAETSLSVTIRDEEGQPSGVSRHRSSKRRARFFRVLAERTARSISERWFRMVHRRNWVLAALRDDDPNTFILVAANREHRLVGADHHARRIMAARGGISKRSWAFEALPHRGALISYLAVIAMPQPV